MYMLRIVCLLVYVSVTLIEAEICKQNELGQEVVMECFSSYEPFCCTNNGRVTCCTEDEFNRRLNGLSTNTLLIIAIATCIMIVGIFYWCYSKYKKKKAVEKEEKLEMEKQIRRLSKLQQKMSFSERALYL